MVSQVSVIISGLRHLFDQVIVHQANKKKRKKIWEAAAMRKRIDKKAHAIEWDLQNTMFRRRNERLAVPRTDPWPPPPLPILASFYILL